MFNFKISLLEVNNAISGCSFGFEELKYCVHAQYKKQAIQNDNAGAQNKYLNENEHSYV